MSIFDEMVDPAQVRAHLAHWRAHVADPARADDFFGLLQDRQIVARLERKLVELEQATPAPVFAEEGGVWQAADEDAWKAALDEWGEGGTLGRLERAKAQVETLATAADGTLGNSAGRLKEILLLTIEDAIAQVQQDDRFIADMAKVKAA